MVDASDGNIIIVVKFFIMSNGKIAKGICKHDRMLAKVKE